MSTYPSVKFVTSAAEAHQFAPDEGREIAFAGRSNSGKSTAINAITHRSGLARVSRTPGRTQLINFFELLPGRRLVDLPGYGFAKVPERVRLHWLALMEHYFNVRQSLVGLMLIVDSRRGLGAQDVAMLEWILARDARRTCFVDKSRQAQSAGFAAGSQGNGGRGKRCCGVRATILGAPRPRHRSRARSHGQLAQWPIKKPRWALVAAIGADQPGMGMTNRVCPLREKSGERHKRSTG